MKQQHVLMRVFRKNSQRTTFLSQALALGRPRLFGPRNASEAKVVRGGQKATLFEIADDRAFVIPEGFGDVPQQKLFSIPKESTFRRPRPGHNVDHGHALYVQAAAAELY